MREDVMTGSCNKRFIDRSTEIWKEAAKLAKGTPCADIYNQGVRTFKKLWPVDVPLSCERIMEGFEVAATTRGRVQECAEQSRRAPVAPKKQQPFIEVSPGAKKAKGHVLLLEYTCDDLSMPLTATKRANVAAARKSAERDKRLCYQITTADEL